MDIPKLLWLCAYGLVLFGLCGYGVHRVHLLILFFRHRAKLAIPATIADDALPFVTVQLPLYNERNVVERLLSSVGELTYPKDRWEIQVLDDSTDETGSICQEGVSKLRAKGLNARQFTRPDRPGYKAGALAAGLAEAKGEFILILDADFLPERDLLMALVPHFTDPKVGMVQARWEHLNREENLLTRIEAILLDGHLMIEQVVRHRSGRFFNFNGTGGMWRRSCIEDAGGWAMDNLTEDLDLSYRAQMKGWRFIFLPDLVVPGELPEEMANFKSQQHRWAKGSIQTLRKTWRPLWEGDYPLLVKFEAMAHLGANLAYLLVFALCILTYPALDALAAFSGWGRVFLLDMPILLLATGSVSCFYLVAQATRSGGAFWRALPLIPILLALGLGMAVNNGLAVLEALVGHSSPFVRTPKRGRLGEVQQTYNVRRSWRVYLELLFAGYFILMLGSAVFRGHWGSMPFLLLIVVGFLYVSLPCIFRLHSRRAGLS